MKLSDNECTALEWLVSEGGSILTSRVPDKNEPGVFGIIPGTRTFKKLERAGLCFFTIEDPWDDGFVFTNEIYITEEGRAALK